MQRSSLQIPVGHGHQVEPMALLCRPMPSCRHQRCHRGPHKMSPPLIHSPFWVRSSCWPTPLCREVNSHSCLQASMPSGIRSTQSPTPRGSPSLKAKPLGRPSPTLGSPQTSRGLAKVPSILLKGPARADLSPARSTNPPLLARSNLPNIRDMASLRWVLPCKPTETSLCFRSHLHSLLIPGSH